MITIDPLPPAPGPDRPTTLDADTQAFLNALQTFQAQLNAFGVDLPLSVAAAMSPGAFSIPYVWKASTSGDPGTGGLSANHATQTSATALLADLVDGIGTNRSAIIDRMDDSTNPVKGYVGVSKVGDGTKWLFFAGGLVTSPTGYKNIAVASGVGSSASPFADGDLVLLTFSPCGDQGIQGIQGPTAQWSNFATSTISGSPTLITFTQAALASAKSALFIFDGVTNPNDLLQVSLRRGGATWSTPVTVHTTSTAHVGAIMINALRLDYQTIVTDMVSSTMSDGQVAASTSTRFNARNAGGVDGVRFSLSGGNSFSAGSIIGEVD